MKLSIFFLCTLTCFSQSVDLKQPNSQRTSEATPNDSIPKKDSASVQNNEKTQSPDPIGLKQQVLGLTCSPIPCGKDFAGPFFVKDGGNLIAYREVGGRMVFEKTSSAPVGQDVKFRAGKWWKSEGKVIYRWEAAVRGWFPRFTSPGDFLAFDVTYDENFIIVALTDEKHKRISEVELFTDEKSSKPLIEKTTYKYNNRLIQLLDSKDLLIFPYEEYHLFYYPYSGRLFWFDGAERKIRELEIPWSPLPSEDKDKAVLTAPPRCIQWIPTPNWGMIFVYDNNSRMTAADEKERIKALRETGKAPRKAPDRKAVRLGLVTREWTKMEIPAELDFPYWSLDGLDFIQMKDIPFNMDSGKKENKKPDPIPKAEKKK